MGSSLAFCASSSTESPPQLRGTKCDFQIVSGEHPGRAGLERFISDGYSRAYGARIVHFADVLVGLSSEHRGWSAAVGYTLATQQPLFMEQYLDGPIEQLLTRIAGAPILRKDVVEVGNLVAARRGDARRVIVHMTSLLHDLGRSWAVLTLTKSLLNSFVRLGIAPIPLVSADPSRLPDKGASWGTYYACEPCVMAASIPMGYRHLRDGSRHRDIHGGAT